MKIFKGRSAADARERITSHLRTIADLEELPFPTLAAVKGLCIAAGLELALACDLIWAAESSRFSQAEASLGTTTLLGGVQRLAERAGASRAREIIYTAEQYDAATFERWNIVNRVVPDGEFETQTRAFAERLARGATRAFAAGKRFVRAYLDTGIRAADTLVDEIAPSLFETEDMRAGVAGLLEHGPREFRSKVVFQGLELLRGVGARYARWNTGTPSVGRIEPIEHQAMEVNIEIGGRANRLPERDGAGGGLGML